MRYLFLTTGSFQFNSSFMRPKELGRHLHELGVEVHYVVDAGAYNDALPSTMPFAQVHRVSGIGRLGKLLSRRRAIGRIDPTVVHLLNPQPSNSATIFGTRRFVVVDWDELLSARTLRHRPLRLARLCESYGRRRADLTVVSSRHMQRLFADKYGLESLYLPYATYVDGMPDGVTPFAGPSVVYLGNLHCDGDYDILIDTWRALGQTPEIPSLHMIGGGVNLSAVRDQVASDHLVNVHVHGFLEWPEVWRHLRHADLLIFPIRDSLGNQMRCPAKVFAYMQAGRPIMTNRVGEVAEALGENAIYVEPSPKGFAEAIRRIFVARLPDVAHDLSRHSWASRAKQLLDAVSRGLNAKGVAGISA